VYQLRWDGGGFAESGESFAAVGDEGFDVGVLAGGFFDVVGYTGQVC
jgi:hypothetical protein